MSTLTIFDHYSNQEHESVPTFLEAWSNPPWNDANVPVGLSIRCEDDDCEDGCTHFPRTADFLVFLPRKEHVKHVKIVIHNEAELQALRDTLRGVWLWSDSPTA